MFGATARSTSAPDRSSARSSPIPEFSKDGILHTPALAPRRQGLALSPHVPLPSSQSSRVPSGRPMHTPPIQPACSQRTLLPTGVWTLARGLGQDSEPPLPPTMAETPHSP